MFRLGALRGVAIVLSVSLAPVAFAETHAIDGEKTGLTLVRSPQYRCYYSAKKLLKQSAQRQLNVPPACIMDMTCVERANPKNWSTFSLVCNGQGGCPEVELCAEEHYNDDPDKAVDLKEAPVSQKRKLPVSDRCKYYSEAFTGVVVRKTTDGDEDKACMSVATCDGKKWEFLACRPWDAPSAPDKIECPQYSDCHADALLLTYGYTKSDLVKLREKRDQSPRLNRD